MHTAHHPNSSLVSSDHLYLYPPTHMCSAPIHNLIGRNKLPFLLHSLLFHSLPSCPLDSVILHVTRISYCCKFCIIRGLLFLIFLCHSSALVRAHSLYFSLCPCSFLDEVAYCCQVKVCHTISCAVNKGCTALYT